MISKREVDGEENDENLDEFEEDEDKDNKAEERADEDGESELEDEDDLPDDVHSKEPEDTLGYGRDRTNYLPAAIIMAILCRFIYEYRAQIKAVIEACGISF